jgi:hypothetical protein
MENALVDLTQALRERLDIIRDEESRCDKEKHMARLRAVSEKVDQLQAALPQPVDPRLAHYLQRRSYDKALEFLEGRDDWTSIVRAVVTALTAVGAGFFDSVKIGMKNQEEKEKQREQSYGDC